MLCELYILGLLHTVTPFPLCAPEIYYPVFDYYGHKDLILALYKQPENYHVRFSSL